MIGMHNKIGGVETFLMNYYRKIDKKKVQFDFINMFDHLCFEKEIIDLGGRIYNVSSVKKNPIEYYKSIKKIIQNNRYEIVHIHMLSMANILPIIVAKKMNVKNIIIHSHNTNTPNGIIRKVLDKLNKHVALKYATDYFACSKDAGIWMFGKNAKFRVINNAVDVEKFKFNQVKRNEMREKLKLNGKFVIGHIGRFSEQKNHDFLIEIFFKYLKENPKAFLVTIGEGELKNQIKNKVADYKLLEKVKFIDPVNNVNDYLQAMDVFILPSKFEGLPVVAVEAETNGLTVITSNNVSKDLPIKELSVYCSLNNIDEWCKKINTSIKKRTDRTIDITNSNYNIDVETKKLEKIYEKMSKKGEKIVK